MKLNEYTGVLAFISPSTIPQLSRLAGDIDSHDYEIREAITQWESYENTAALLRRMGAPVPKTPMAKPMNKMIGKEAYLVCGYASYFLTGESNPLSLIPAKKLTSLTYSAYVERHKYPDRFFRILEFEREMQYGTSRRYAFAIVTREKFQLAEIISQLVAAEIGDSFFGDLRLALDQLNPES